MFIPGDWFPAVKLKLPEAFEESSLYFYEVETLQELEDKEFKLHCAVDGVGYLSYVDDDLVEKKIMAPLDWLVADVRPRTNL
jgi:hypothetical protein